MDAKHPHIDPRQPRNNSAPQTNPPVFAWKPEDEKNSWRLQVGRDPDLKDLVLEQTELYDPLFLPTTAFESGTYYWSWSSMDGEEAGDTFAFEITSDAAIVEVLPVEEWLKRLSDGHPRIYTNPEAADKLRKIYAGDKKDDLDRLVNVAEEIIREEHSLAEPPFLADSQADYQKYFEVWYKVMQDARKFVRGAELMGLAYTLTGEVKYGRAACERLASVSLWDPDGSSHLTHNDEAHMMLLWYGTQAIDRVWDIFTDDERELVIDQFRRRGIQTYEHMHGKGSYGISRFDSHAGREIVFLAQIAFVLHEYIPEAHEWLEWLRPVLCGIWPIWSGDDGGWAEGPSYGLAYVTIMTFFASSLKNGTGIDLYQRPFWQGHARWRQWCLPPYAEWIGFGDHSERWQTGWKGNADLCEIIARETGSDEFSRYIEQFRAEAETCTVPAERKMPGINDLLFLSDKELPSAISNPQQNMYQEFPDVGWCAVRTDLQDAEKDIAMIFRSSPYGSVSHSHANHNDFILHAGGKVLAMPSGYYDGYGSDHHANWNWQTKSHNCITLSDAGQTIRSYEARGELLNSFENEDLVYFCGNADEAYKLHADRMRRHVIFLKAHNCFVMVDECELKKEAISNVQWNIHSWAPFDWNEEQKQFKLEREGVSLTGMFMYHYNSYCSLTEGWDPHWSDTLQNEQWLDQYHLRFTTSGYQASRRLGVVLVPDAPKLEAASVETKREGELEIARIGDNAIVAVNQVDDPMLLADKQIEGLIAVQINDAYYAVSNSGIITI